MLDWITTTVASLGYGGIALLMLLENLVPPIPSELIMPLAGFAAAEGKLSFPGVIMAGIAGSVVGALPWYFAGWYYGRERLSRVADRYGRWIGVSGADIQESTRWFARNGSAAVLVGRVVPGARTLVSVPAGIAGMPLIPFLIWTTLGTTVWTCVLASAGYLLQANWYLVEDYIGVFGKVSLGFGLAAAIALIVWKRKGAAAKAARRTGQ